MLIWLLKVTSRSLVFLHGLAAAGLFLSALRMPTPTSWVLAVVACGLVPVHAIFWRRLRDRKEFGRLVDETTVLRAAEIMADRRLGVHDKH